nr:hypothetical protein [Tanacetum cinerariifolium]
VLSTEESYNSLSMREEHLDTILTTESDEFIKSGVKNLISIPTLNANPTPSSDFKTKSSSTSLNSLLEETNTFDNSLLEFETFFFDVEEISSVALHYLLSLRNEDTIFDPGICNSPFSRPDVSYRCRTFPRFNVLPERPMEIFSSTCSPMDK